MCETQRFLKGRNPQRVFIFGNQYKNLSDVQKKDLDQWRATPEGQAAVKKQLDEQYGSNRRAKVSATKAKNKKKSAMKKKKLTKKREAKEVNKTKAALASLFKDYSSDEDSESNGLTSIVKAISKLKKDQKKAKVSSTEGMKDQTKVKGGDNVAKLLKIIGSVK